jgi:hypothetical protein
MSCPRMNGLLLACLCTSLLGIGSAGAWDGASGVLAVTTWAGPESVDLTPLDKDCWLLAHNEDMAVLLVPGGYVAPGELGGLITSLESPAGEGAYFLYLVENASRARFEGSTRVLAAHGHTVLVWTDDEVPQLTPVSRATLHGLIQPVRISLAPKVWPTVAGPAPEGGTRTRTEFDPIVDEIVQGVTEQEYVAKWQALDDFETRYYSTAQNEAASQWMYDYFVSLGLQAKFQVFNYQGSRRNVIGILPGQAYPEKVVYLCGHFDSITYTSPQTSAPGADDNASGTAAFLEGARVLSQYDFEYTIKFVGFNCEEQGMVGSNAYVQMIYALGEDVVGCFNLDMVAYRGTDPAPADLVIYTDTASLPIAEVFADACLEYFPTELEPVVLNEAMTSSDHGSFWSYGYKAICGIEGEPWGPDFCPWYHTTEDRIEQYPHDYPTHCSTAAIAAAAQMAIPVYFDACKEPVTQRLVFHPVRPNPAPGSASLVLDLPQSAPVEVRVFDAGGRQVRVLHTGPLVAGRHTLAWDGQTADGARAGSGVYWIKGRTAGLERTARVVVTR